LSPSRQTFVLVFGIRIAIGILLLLALLRGTTFASFHVGGIRVQLHLVVATTGLILAAFDMFAFAFTLAFAFAASAIAGRPLSFENEFWADLSRRFASR